jgi:hypothetical protein
MKKVILHLCADTGSDTWAIPEQQMNFEVVMVGEADWR